MAINDGGPAFPQPLTMHPSGVMDYPSNGWGMGGMTMRDYFAAHATKMDVDTHRGMETHRSKVDGELVITFKYTYEQARYAYADAMLAAREAK